MQTAPAEPSPVVSPRIYALILSSPRLRRMLLPQGLLPSPYEILDYQSTLILHDHKGIKATLERRQRIRFVQNGVAGIMDHIWGDGVVTYYENEAGSLEDSFRDEGRRHLVIGLRRPMGRGESLAFRVRRAVMVGLTGDREWVETTIDHPVERLKHTIVFPKERPCQVAALHHEGRTIPLTVTRLADGKTRVEFDLRRPSAQTPYTVRWSW